MKKILNDPADYVDETLDGLIAAHGDIYARPERRVIARARGAIPGKVGIVTGGGSGHLPVFAGYVGRGCWMLRQSGRYLPHRRPRTWFRRCGTRTVASACCASTATTAATS